MRQRILCVEDDKTMQTIITGALADYFVVCVDSLKSAETELRSKKIDAVILDIMLPDGDGLKFWAKMSTEPQFASLPIMFLTTQTEISNKILAFSVGAEDFMPKPIDPLELQARLARRLRTKATQEKEQTIRRLSDVEIDLGKQRVLHYSQNTSRDLALTSLEMKILTLLAGRLEQVYSRDQILNQVWGSAHVSDRTVDSHVAHLRAKLEGTGIEVQTVKNFGYRLNIKA